MPTADRNVRYEEPQDRLYKATKAFIRFCQGVFQSREPGSYRWSQDENDTEILISSVEPQNKETTNIRPFISINRSVASYAGTSRDQTASRSFAGDKKTFSDLVTTGIIITCTAKEGVEAGEIAYVLFRLIPAFKPQIQRLGQLHHISNSIQLNPETPHGAIMPGSLFSEWKSVQLFIPVSIHEEVRFDEGFHNLLQNVTISMSLTD